MEKTSFKKSALHFFICLLAVLLIYTSRGSLLLRSHASSRFCRELKRSLFLSWRTFTAIYSRLLKTQVRDLWRWDSRCVSFYSIQTLSIKCAPWKICFPYDMLTCRHKFIQFTIEVRILNNVRIATWWSSIPFFIIPLILL